MVFGPGKRKAGDRKADDVSPPAARHAGSDSEKEGGQDKSGSPLQEQFAELIAAGKNAVLSALTGCDASKIIESVSVETAQSYVRGKQLAAAIASGEAAKLSDKQRKDLAVYTEIHDKLIKQIPFFDDHALAKAVDEGLVERAKQEARQDKGSGQGHANHVEPQAINQPKSGGEPASHQELLKPAVPLREEPSWDPAHAVRSAFGQLQNEAIDQLTGRQFGAHQLVEHISSEQVARLSEGLHLRDELAAGRKRENELTASDKERLKSLGEFEAVLAGSGLPYDKASFKASVERELIEKQDREKTGQTTGDLRAEGKGQGKVSGSLPAGKGESEVNAAQWDPLKQMKGTLGQVQNQIVDGMTGNQFGSKGLVDKMSSEQIKSISDGLHLRQDIESGRKKESDLSDKERKSLEVSRQFESILDKTNMPYDKDAFKTATEREILARAERETTVVPPAQDATTGNRPAQTGSEGLRQETGGGTARTQGQTDAPGGGTARAQGQNDAPQDKPVHTTGRNSLNDLPDKQPEGTVQRASEGGRASEGQLSISAKGEQTSNRAGFIDNLLPDGKPARAGADPTASEHGQAPKDIGENSATKRTTGAEPVKTSGLLAASESHSGGASGGERVSKCSGGAPAERSERETSLSKSASEGLAGSLAADKSSTSAPYGATAPGGRAYVAAPAQDNSWLESKPKRIPALDAGSTAGGERLRQSASTGSPGVDGGQRRADEKRASAAGADTASARLRISDLASGLKNVQTPQPARSERDSARVSGGSDLRVFGRLDKGVSQLESVISRGFAAFSQLKGPADLTLRRGGMEKGLVALPAGTLRLVIARGLPYPQAAGLTRTELSGRNSQATGTRFELPGRPAGKEPGAGLILSTAKIDRRYIFGTEVALAAIIAASGVARRRAGEAAGFAQGRPPVEGQQASVVTGIARTLGLTPAAFSPATRIDRRYILGTEVALAALIAAGGVGRQRLDRALFGSPERNPGPDANNRSQAKTGDRKAGSSKPTDSLSGPGLTAVSKLIDRRFVTGAELALVAALSTAAVRQDLGARDKTEVYAAGDADLLYAAESSAAKEGGEPHARQSEQPHRLRDKNDLEETQNEELAELTESLGQVGEIEANAPVRPTVLHRPTTIVSPRDTLVSIAEAFFHDPQVAWLIADLNSHNTRESFVDGKRVVELKSRQLLELPVWQDLEKFAAAKPAHADWQNLVTIVERSEIDREALQTALGGALGINSANAAPFYHQPAGDQQAKRKATSWPVKRWISRFLTEPR